MAEEECTTCDILDKLTNPEFITSVGDLVGKIASDLSPLTLLKDLVLEENKLICKLIEDEIQNQLVSGSTFGKASASGDEHASLSLSLNGIVYRPGDSLDAKLLMYISLFNIFGDELVEEKKELAQALIATLTSGQ